MTATWVNTVRSAIAAIRPIPGKAHGFNSHDIPTQIGMDRGPARHGAVDARAGDANRSGRRAADHGALRPPDHRLRTRRRASRPAVRVVPPERNFQRDAEKLRRLPYHGLDLQCDAKDGHAYSEHEKLRGVQR